MLVLYNARVYSLDPQIPSATALAVDQGRILALGQDGQILSNFSDRGRAVDVGGRAIIPGLTDAPRGMAAVLDAAREAGATHAWSNVLNLRPGTREHFLDVLRREWPEELERYQRLYPAGGAGYLARVAADPIERRVEAVRRGSRIEDRRRIVLSPQPEPEQLPLAI